MDKSSLKIPKILNLASFLKPEACGQTELPDRSVLIGQKLVENAKIKKFKCDILGFSFSNKVFTMLKFKTLKTQFAVRTSKCTLRVP